MCQFILLLLAIPFVSTFPTRCSSFTGKRYKLCMKYDKEMELQYLSDQMATCNDGSSAGYYVRRNTNSRLWIVYLAGGWFCHNEKSCLSRMNAPHTKLMTTSKLLSNEWHGNGLLKDDFHKNPQFWNANHVYVPYCSSDFWIGNATRETSSGVKISFHGSHIVTSVIKELLKIGLKDSSRLILAGSSAGGVGVLHNIDRISKLLEALKVNIDVRGLIDSAWFVDNGISSNCASPNKYDCHPQLIFKDAVKYWNAEIQDTCANGMKVEKHRCLFAYNVMKDIRTPIFVFQWIYDSVQILADNKDLETRTKDILQEKYMTYVRDLGIKMKRSLNTLSGKHGVFAASCISHTALTSTSVFEDIKVNGKSLNDALYCWLSANKRNSRSKGSNKRDLCKQRLVDKSELFNRPNCPAIYNPFTGEPVKLGLPLFPDDTTPNVPDLAKEDIELINSLFTGSG